MRRAGSILLLAAGLTLALAIIGYVAVTLASVFWLRSGTLGTTAEVAAGDSIVVTNDCGPIRLSGGTPGVVRAETDVRWSFQEPTLTSERTGSTVNVTVDCPSVSLGVSGAPDLTVDMPSGQEVTAHSSAGGITAHGLSGSLTASSDAGSIQGFGLSSARTLAETSAGSISLGYASPPDSVRATTSAGSVTVLVPRDDTTYAVEADTSVGSRTVEVRTDPSAERTIEVRSSAGSVRVAYASP